jgi:hypothetical protein
VLTTMIPSSENWFSQLRPQLPKFATFDPIPAIASSSVNARTGAALDLRQLQRQARSAGPWNEKY